MVWRVPILALLFGCFCCQVSCQLPIAKVSWHEKYNWKAEDYFDDPKVVELCRAIEANDVKSIDRLVASGADVNMRGKGNMTPLLWAYPDNKLERFNRLLEHGADPNIFFESDFGCRGALLRGESITELASGTRFDGYFDAVFDNKGDPNLRFQSALSNGDTPLFVVIRAAPIDQLYRIRRLIELGADINHVNAVMGRTPVVQAVTRAGQFALALELLRMGADYSIYASDVNNMRLIHSVLIKGNRLRAYWSSEHEAQYNELIKWLEDHGESVKQAEEDLERWKSWTVFDGEFQRKNKAEIAARKAATAAEAMKESESNGDVSMGEATPEIETPSTNKESNE